MKTLLCKVMIVATFHGGPVSCHPEILVKGTVTVNRRGQVEVSGWWIDCSRGGPYRAGHGVTMCATDDYVIKVKT